MGKTEKEWALEKNFLSPTSVLRLRGWRDTHAARQTLQRQRLERHWNVSFSGNSGGWILLPKIQKFSSKVKKFSSKTPIYLPYVHLFTIFPSNLSLKINNSGSRHWQKGIFSYKVQQGSGLSGYLWNVGMLPSTSEDPNWRCRYIIHVNTDVPKIVSPRYKARA